MQISIATDFGGSGIGDPSPQLRQVADAGFSHVHWCQEYYTDYFYTQEDIAQIRGWFDEFGLRMFDLHGTGTADFDWTSIDENKRQAGVELLKNRLDFVAQLGEPGGSVVMHLGMAGVGGTSLRQPGATQVRRSIDDIEEFCLERNVFLALENSKNFAILRQFLASYGPEYVGLCFDSGHSNLPAQNGLDHLEDLKDRLIAVHLHDNNSKGDFHQPLFLGTVDWERLAGLLARSSYSKCLTHEVSMEFSGTDDMPTFLRIVQDGGVRFEDMIAKHRAAASSN